MLSSPAKWNPAGGPVESKAPRSSSGISRQRCFSSLLTARICRKFELSAARIRSRSMAPFELPMLKHRPPEGLDDRMAAPALCGRTSTCGATTGGGGVGPGAATCPWGPGEGAAAAAAGAALRCGPADCGLLGRAGGAPGGFEARANNRFAEGWSALRKRPRENPPPAEGGFVGTFGVPGGFGGRLGRFRLCSTKRAVLTELGAFCCSPSAPCLLGPVVLVHREAADSAVCRLEEEGFTGGAPVKRTPSAAPFPPGPRGVAAIGGVGAFGGAPPPEIWRGCC